MKTTEIRERGSEELRMLMEEMSEDLYKQRIEHALDQLKETHRLKELKRGIARIKTILAEREAQAAVAASSLSALAGSLVLFDSLETTFRKVTVPRDPDCALCGRCPSGVTRPASPATTVNRMLSAARPWCVGMTFSKPKMSWTVFSKRYQERDPE